MERARFGQIQSRWHSGRVLAACPQLCGLARPPPQLPGGCASENLSVAPARAVGPGTDPAGLQVSISAIRWQAEGAAAAAAEEEPTNATAKQGWGQTKITDILKLKVRSAVCSADWGAIRASREPLLTRTLAR